MHFSPHHVPMEIKQTIWFTYGNRPYVGLHPSPIA